MWKNRKKGKISTKSMYNHMSNNDSGTAHKRIWKAKNLENKKKLYGFWKLERQWKKIIWLERTDMEILCAISVESKKNIDNLFFACPIAKVVWGAIVSCFNSGTRLISYDQFLSWIEVDLPGGERMHLIRLAVVCWAIWKSRNKACFDKVLIKHLCHIVFQVSILLTC